MKRIAILCVLVLLAGTALTAQESSLNITETDHYRVYSQISEENAADAADRLEAYFELFNNYLRFDETELQAKLNVRIFDSKDRFDQYLSSIVGETKDNFVYLQYSTVKKSELLCYDMADPAEFESALIRHAFIQVFKSFIKNPPLWLQQGFAVFFERTEYDAENSFAVYKENLGWLDTLKSLIESETMVTDSEARKLLALNDLLQPTSAVLETRNDIFHAQAWGFIMFLLNSENKNYNRFLWDSISSLKPDATVAENQNSIQAQATAWVNEYLLYTDFTDFITSIKTFPDVVREGVELYALGNYEDAEKSFIRAISLDGSHYIPYYYLGLIHYAKEDYSLADYYYQSSLMLGADEALVYYALGINSFADDRLEDAESYLIEAADMNPESYGEKTDRILARIDDMYAAPVDFEESDDSGMNDSDAVDESMENGDMSGETGEDNAVEAETDGEDGSDSETSDADSGE